MARTTVGRSACLMCYNSRVKLAELLSPSAPFFIIGTCFSSKVQISDSGKFDLGGKDKSHSALMDFLKSYEFSEAEIHEIIKRYPQILSFRVSTNLKPKLDYIVERGLQGSALHRVIASNPSILDRSLHKHIKPRYQFLEAYLMERVNFVIIRNSWLLRRVGLELCIEYFKKLGVPAEGIAKLLASGPSTLAYGMSRLTKLVEATRAFGIKPADPMFIWYIRVIGSMSETSWKKKVEVFKSIGWSDQDVRVTLMHYPLCFEVSEEKLRRNMDFYVNTVKIERKAIVAYPRLLMLSLHGRIFPRYQVMKLLKEHNLLESCKASTFFTAMEKRFMRIYIEKNLQQVPHLLQVYLDSKKVKADIGRLHS